MEEPTIQGLFNFVLVQDPARKVDDSSFVNCAVGDYWQEFTGQRPTTKRDDFHEKLVVKIQCRSDWYHIFAREYVCPRNGFWRRLFGLPEPKMYVKDRVYGDLQAKIRVTRPPCTER